MLRATLARTHASFIVVEAYEHVGFESTKEGHVACFGTCLSLVLRGRGRGVGGISLHRTGSRRRSHFSALKCGRVARTSSTGAQCNVSHQACDFLQDELQYLNGCTCRVRRACIETAEGIRAPSTDSCVVACRNPVVTCWSFVYLNETLRTTDMLLGCLQMHLLTRQ